MKKMSIIALLLIAVVVTSSSVSGTYAKYTSTFTSEADSARVAKWSFKVNETDMTTANNEFTFDLFNTVNDTKGGAAESDVKVGTDETIIAPGTEGSFAIKLENNSEVNATYDVEYSIVNNANIPVEFSIDNGTTWTTDLKAVADKAIAMNGGQDTITINWRWTYDAEDRTASTGESTTLADSTSDATDTTLGEKETADTISVSASITVTQVD